MAVNQPPIARSTGPARGKRWLPIPDLICGAPIRLRGIAPLRIAYDAEVDALYIRFLDATVTTEHLAEGIAADYAADGRLAGIEILDPLKRFGDPEVFRRVILKEIALTKPDHAT